MSGIISLTAFGGRSGIIGRPPSFIAYGGSGNTTIADGATVPFSTIIQRGSGMHASTGVFTCPVGGFYHFGAQITTNEHPPLGFSFKINASSYGILARTTSGADTQSMSENDTLLIFGAAELPAGETVSIVNMVGANRDITLNAISHTYFRGYLIN